MLVEGSYVVAGPEGLTSGALSVVTRDELLERAGGWPVTDRDLDEAAAKLSSAVDNLAADGGLIRASAGTAEV